MARSTHPTRRGPVRAVFFDAGNTLIRMNYDVLAEQITAHGVPVGPEGVRRAELRARVRLDPELAPGVSTESRSASDRYLRYMLEELSVTDAATVEALAGWRRGFNPPVGVWNRADPEAEAALVMLAEHGVRAAVISNSNGSIRSILTDLGLAQYLEFVLDSAEVGVEKPDPRIFWLALDRAGVEPDHARYVGDLYSVDVLGARAAGMEGILLDPAALWGARDCPTVPGVLAACRLVLGQRA